MAFFQKVQFVLQISKSRKKIFQKTISRQYHFTFIVGKFKFQAQDSFLDFFLDIWRFEKQIALSEKKPPLTKGPIHDIFAKKVEILIIILVFSPKQPLCTILLTTVNAVICVLLT